MTRPKSLATVWQLTRTRDALLLPLLLPLLLLLLFSFLFFPLLPPLLSYSPAVSQVRYLAEFEATVSQACSKALGLAINVTHEGIQFRLVVQVSDPSRGG